MAVTPRVGVWIETGYTVTGFSDDNVTPRVGVWIETFDAQTAQCNQTSHTPRGCVD